jgi:peptidyl-prolyl cis-trans isomerase SurA
MRIPILLWLLLAGVIAGQAEIIDRIAVTVDKMVITGSDVVNHLRVAAFLNNEPLNLDGNSRRDAADRLVEQVLIRREMEISRYPAPKPADIEPILADLLERRFADDQAYKDSLAKYGIAEPDLREALLLQLTVLRFIEFRFRPGIVLDDDEVEVYYQNEFTTEWSSRNTAPPPPLDDVRDEIEESLIEAHVDEALDQWLKQVKAVARLHYRQGVFD